MTSFQPVIDPALWHMYQEQKNCTFCEDSGYVYLEDEILPCLCQADQTCTGCETLNPYSRSCRELPCPRIMGVCEFCMGDGEIVFPDGRVEICLGCILN